jgi:methylated-DNA-[protein]-cysteine S-methyltransferase
MSYGQIAEAIGHPLASRAVGSANAGTNLPIIIPCHRVVASNGLGGYGGGLAMKVKLLQIEGALKAGRS